MPYYGFGRSVIGAETHEGGKSSEFDNSKLKENMISRTVRKEKGH